MADEWEDIYQEDWQNIELRIDEDAHWHLSFDYIDEQGFQWHYPEERISYDDFLDIYDEAKELDQPIEIIVDSP